MKKFLSITLIGLLFCCAASCALANGWGLRGGIYDIVTRNDDYDDYVAGADDGNDEVEGRHVNHAILSNRYHSQLISAVRKDGRWVAETVSTTAVYQPGDVRGERSSLEHTEYGFCLRYGDEMYLFHWNAVRNAYCLMEVRYNENSAYGSSLLYSSGDDETPRGYQLWQGGPENSGKPIGDAVWEREPLTLAEFNITLLPRTMQDVRQMNSVGSRLRLAQQGDRRFGEYELLAAQKKSVRLPVYSAPSEDAWRAADGKASVSTGGEIRLLGEYGEWTLVSYDVSMRTSRIGFVHANLMQQPHELPLSEVQHPLNTIRDTYLTDDPDVSQYAQVQIPAGTRLTGLAAYGPYYAYVAYEQSGKTFWGFVPLKDLTSPAWEQDLALRDTDIDENFRCRWDVMDLLIGKWTVAPMDAFPEGTIPKLVLFSGGGYEIRYEYAHDLEYNGSLGRVGRWYVFDCLADSPDAGTALYELQLRDEGNVVLVFGLTLNNNGTLTLVDEENVWVYERGEYSTYGNG